MHCKVVLILAIQNILGVFWAKKNDGLWTNQGHHKQLMKNKQSQKINRALKNSSTHESFAFSKSGPSTTSLHSDNTGTLCASLISHCTCHIAYCAQSPFHITYCTQPPFHMQICGIECQPGCPSGIEAEY